jgi:hypothetical protein
MLVDGNPPYVHIERMTSSAKHRDWEGETMADDEKCPRCGKVLVVHGSFYTNRVNSGFRPQELRLFSLSLQFPVVPISSAMVACASCGLVWAELDAATLRQKLHDLGNEDVRRRLSLTEGE